jgi:hypothetical protein
VKKLEGNYMVRPKKRKQQQCCDLMTVIDTIEKAAPTAMTILRALEAITKMIFTDRRKTK